MMLHRRCLLALTAALAAPARATGGVGGHIHALLVGINAYRDQRSTLFGCLNDVRMIAASLGGLGASVTTLTDTNRAACLARWEAATAPLAPGDTFIFHFSGHGLRDPRLAPGVVGDGNRLLFRDFDPVAAPGEALVDTELHRMLIALHRRGVQPIAVLDCCYAGSLTRGIDPRAAGAERYRTPQYVDDMIAAVASQPPVPPGPPPAELAPVLFLAAGQATEAVPEIRGPDGKECGALSLGFARALAGAAMTRTPGVLTRGELFEHIRAVTRIAAESRQHPVMRPDDRLDEAILPVPVRPAGARAPAPAAVATAQAPVRLGVLNLPEAAAAAVVQATPGAVSAAGDAWDLRWDGETLEVFGPGRDRLAEKVPASALGAVVQRVRAERRLAALALASGLSFRLVWPRATDPAQNDAAHPAGRRLELRTANLRLPYLVAFNLTGDGIVQALYPDPSALIAAQERFDPGAAPWVKPFCVRRPFGADLAVAVASDRAAPALVGLLRQRNREAAIPEIMAALEAALEGADWQIGTQTVVTQANSGEERECGR